MTPLRHDRGGWGRGLDSTALLLMACISGCTEHNNQRQSQFNNSSDASFYTTSIHEPESLTSILLPGQNFHGEPMRVRCGTCHENRTQPLQLPERPEDLGGPHQGMRFEHGSLPCRSCHDPERYNGLRLASGEQIPLTQVMRLCAQCHGPQFRDYSHGAHGGMNGYWDLRRGPRTRNNCVDCHDPHRPAYPQFTPAPAPPDSVGRGTNRHE